MVIELWSDAKKAEAKGVSWPAQNSIWSKSFEVFCKTVFKFYCPLTKHGVKNLPKPPFIICSNHQSHLDSTMLMYGTGLHFKEVGLIAAKDYFFDQSHRFFLHYMMNLVPIARGTGPKAIKDSIVACRSFLNSGGQALIIYPEGTRSMSGKMAHFKQGAAILAHDLDIPLVPAYVAHSADSLAKGSYVLKPKKLAVHYGKALKVSDWIGLDEKEDRRAIFIAYRECTKELERRVREMAKDYE